MDGNLTQWDDSVLRAVRQAAQRSYSTQRGYVELEDLQQEGYLWCLQNPGKVADWVEDGRRGMAVLHTALYHHMHKYTMKERYRKDGTQPGDYYFYQRAVITELLPEAFEDEPNYGSSSSDLNATVRSGKPLSEGGDRMAMLADIRSALGALNPDELAIVRKKFGEGEVLPDEQLAQWFEIPLSTMNRRVNSALRKMARALGSEPVKGRRALSNAQAQHHTREQE
jgi:DNA-directed RNA polymerase specialized sigma24 family protein